MGFWACAQLVPHRTATALRFLRINGHEVFCPQMRSPRRLHPEPLFPNYTFLGIELRWHTAARSPGVMKLIMDGDHPAKVPEGVIQQLRARERNGVIELPSPPGLRRGDAIKITKGPFADQLATFGSLKPHQRCEVLLRWLGSERRLLLPRRHIVALPSRQSLGSE